MKYDSNENSLNFTQHFLKSCLRLVGSTSNCLPCDHELRSACGRLFVRQLLAMPPPQIRWRRRRQNLRLIPALARNFNGIFIGLSLPLKTKLREGIIILISSVRLSVLSSLPHNEFELTKGKGEICQVPKNA